MSLAREMYTKSLRKKAKRGFRDYPVASVAWYGPDDKRVSQGAVGIVEEEDGKVTALERWFSEDDDIRNEPSILHAILEFIRDRGVRSVVHLAFLGSPRRGFALGLAFIPNLATELFALCLNTVWIGTRHLLSGMQPVTATHVPPPYTPVVSQTYNLAS